MEPAPAYTVRGTRGSRSAEKREPRVKAEEYRWAGALGLRGRWAETRRKWSSLTGAKEQNKVNEQRMPRMPKCRPASRRPKAGKGGWMAEGKARRGETKEKAVKGKRKGWDSEAQSNHRCHPLPET